LVSVETCYRHPGRETGVSCSNCGRPICPDCMTSTPVGMRCPECAPGPSRAQRAASAVSPNTPICTYVLMAICIAIEFGVLSSGGGALGAGHEDTKVFQDFALRIGGFTNFLGQEVPGVATGEWWRLVTSGFLHYGLTHLLFNMVSLYFLGSMLEPAIRRSQFLTIYFVSLLAGSFGGILLQGPADQGAGASGAVFGLMGAALILMRSRGIDPWGSGLPLWLGLNLVFTFSIANISIGAHLGGLAGGTLAALVMFELPRRVRGLPRQAPTLLAAGVGLLAVIGAVAAA
jgi:membrane associated rhomboid family serine protease